MTAEEKAIVRELIAAYQAAADQPTDVSDAHCENAEQDLPWRQDWERALFLQDLAFRVAMQRRAANG